MKTLNNKHLTIIVSFLFLITMGSCNEEKSPETKSGDDKKEASAVVTKLTSDSWVSSEFKLNGLSVWTVIPACIRDNIQQLNSDGTGERREGEKKCNESDPDAIDISWELAEEETILVIKPGVINTTVDSMEIVSLTDTELIAVINSQNGKNELHFTHPDK